MFVTNNMTNSCLRGVDLESIASFWLCLILSVGSLLGQKVPGSKTVQPLIYCGSKVCSGRVRASIGLSVNGPKWLDLTTIPHYWLVDSGVSFRDLVFWNLNFVLFSSLVGMSPQTSGGACWSWLSQKSAWVWVTWVLLWLTLSNFAVNKLEF